VAGIVSYGGYIPLWRLSRDTLVKGLPGEKAVGSFDEDSITMAVAATIDCFRGCDRRAVDGLFFASTTSPYKEKLAAATVATAADLRRDILTADFGNSLRAATSCLLSATYAVKADAAREIVVTAADSRLGIPGSDFERNFADGAASVLIGNSDVAVSIEDSFSVYDEIVDVWRAEGDTFVRSSEGRFVAIEGYLRLAEEAAKGLMRKGSLTPKEFNKVVIGLPDERRQLELARTLGFDRSQVQDSLLPTVGDTGAAYALMLLVAALEEAKEGDQMLFLSYGNGSDAFLLRVTEQIGKIKGGRGMKKYLTSKRMLKDYRTYLQFRGLLPQEKPPHPLGEIATPALWRERDQNIRLHGGKCRACGRIQYPPQRVCINCGAKDQWEEIGLSQKKGTLFAYSVDYTAPPPDVPAITAIVNFEGGGRMQCLLTDREGEEVRVDMPVEMSFRKLEFRDGIHNYCWKCIPARRD
jgi:hydroxymethylglutaryl-CoA synthase